MRAARDSGPDGLAGMAAVVEHRDLRLLRPLLAVPRQRLTATVEGRGVRWIDDPSNQDRRFERVRIRQDGPAVPAQKEEGRPARERLLAELALDALQVDAAGLALDHVAVSRLRKEITEGLLSRLVQTVSRRDYPPRRDRLSRAAARLVLGVRPGKSGKSQDFTLSGCQLLLRRDPDTRRLRWIVRPENGTTPDNKPGQPLVPAAFFACGPSAASHLD
jgi:tRNA(Ile)-lysidine synthase